ncbi:hypothetical protein [Treponema pedis]|uniref:Uncharacterized protein n=1 Tax=Treponema pedis str. T A4 TaxID=1291379 RepID=S5ZSU9_9SPIR|nr:hypothetical protein [Treponema pedis]AGT43190.1 hypothetical protein TPE_0694 [Treponema pedis str. T A4]
MGVAAAGVASAPPAFSTAPCAGIAAQGIFRQIFEKPAETFNVPNAGLTTATIFLRYSYIINEYHL